ncbi:MAG: hypothetical protein R2867_30385 [Caldilineaceae bacterium]
MPIQGILSVCGVGEVPIVPPGAPLAHAIYNATGFRSTEMPMNPGRAARRWPKKTA